MTSSDVPVFGVLLAMAVTALMTQGLTRLLIRQAARQVDPQGFIIILESNEVLGEGFKELQGK